MRMLSVLLFAMVLLLALCPLATAGLSYGIKGGLSLSSQDFDYSNGLDIGNEYREGIAAGVFLEWEGVAGFGVVAEAMYVQKGMEIEYTVTAPDSPEPIGTMTLDQRVDYICFPLLAKKSFGLAAWEVYVAAGPRFDFMLNHDAELDFGDIYDDFSDFELGADAVLGAGFGPFLAEVRYCPSFTKAYEEGILEVTNEGFLVLAGFRF